jgi:hypothetical protein
MTGHIFDMMSVGKLRAVVRQYNLHLKIVGYSKIPKQELITHMKKHLSVGADGNIFIKDVVDVIHKTEKGMNEVAKNHKVIEQVKKLKKQVEKTEIKKISTKGLKEAKAKLDLLELKKEIQGTKIKKIGTKKLKEGAKLLEKIEQELKKPKHKSLPVTEKMKEEQVKVNKMTLKQAKAEAKKEGLSLSHMVNGKRKSKSRALLLEELKHLVVKKGQIKPEAKEPESDSDSVVDAKFEAYVKKYEKKAKKMAKKEKKVKAPKPKEEKIPELTDKEVEELKRELEIMKKNKAMEEPSKEEHIKKIVDEVSKMVKDKVYINDDVIDYLHKKIREYDLTDKHGHYYTDLGFFREFIGLDDPSGNKRIKLYNEKEEPKQDKSIAEFLEKEGFKNKPSKKAVEKAVEKIVEPIVKKIVTATSQQLVDEFKGKRSNMNKKKQ